MRKDELEASVQACKSETKDAIQIVFDELNQGQQKKILKNESVKELFDRYGVEYTI